MTTVYAIKDPTILYGDHGGTDPHKNYRVAPGTALEVIRTISGWYEVRTPASGIVFTYPEPYSWNWVSMADVSLTRPEPGPEPGPEPIPGTAPSDAEVGRVVKYLFRG